MKKSISEQIYDYLLKEIREHRIMPGEALPSENTLCREFYVSRPTVRKAVAQLIEEGYIHSRPGLGSFVNSSQSNIATVNREQILIGIDGVDFHNEYQYYSHINKGARDVANDFDVSLCLTDLTDLLMSKDKKVDAFIATRVDGENFEKARILQERGIPLIILNRYPEQTDLSYISVDFKYETFLVINRLLKNGANNIALIGRQSRVATAARTHGWEEAYKIHKKPIPYNLAIDFQDFNNDNNDLAQFFKQNEIDAVFITAGYLLPPVLTSLAKAGIKAPEDISIYCFDDIERFCAQCSVPISYIKMPLHYMGSKAVEYLVHKLETPQEERVTMTLNASLVINRCKYLL